MNSLTGDISSLKKNKKSISSLLTKNTEGEKKKQLSRKYFLRTSLHSFFLKQKSLLFIYINQQRIAKK